MKRCIRRGPRFDDDVGGERRCRRALKAMPPSTDEVLPIRTSDVVVAVQATRSASNGDRTRVLSLVEQTKMVTAASELARNTCSSMAAAGRP